MIVFLILLFILLGLGGSRDSGSLTLSQAMKMREDSVRGHEELAKLRCDRRGDPNFKGCDFCFDTAWGELKDGTVVPCPEHNGLCL
jgi:hypothetical protein